MQHTYILGISAFYHDSAACLLKDGVIVAAAQEERFTRKKHDFNFPSNAVRYCLESQNITSKDLTYVAFYDKPWIKFERLLETYLTFIPSGFKSYLRALPLWLKEKLWMGDFIKKELDFEGEIIYPEHHESHAASAFYPSPFESAAVITVDGVGEWTTTSWGVGNGKDLTLKQEIKFPHSLGLLYSAFTYYTGFKVNSGEYKLMGLAPYGEPLYTKQIYDNLIDIREDGSFKLDMSYFNYCQGMTMTSEKFHTLFGGPPRKPESKISQKEMDLARSIQEVTEAVMLKMARWVRKESGEKNLCLAGGVALNCVANGKILQEKIFDNIWVQPAAGDAGGALGAACYVWYKVMGKERKALGGENDLQSGSYLGPRYTNEEIRSWLKEKNYPAEMLTEDQLVDTVSKLIAEGNIIGWFNGKMEFGPRALGARSILGDARKLDMQKTMNLKIKFRESFRPFAPSCLREDVSEYFEIDSASPYMLMVAPVKKERRVMLSESEEKLFGIDKLNIPRSDIPSVTHVDYSARIQTVDGKTNKKYYNLLRSLKEKTGYGLVINTSFNVRGEPIVCTPDDAYRCFMRTGIDVLVLEDNILYKQQQPELKNDTNWQEEFELD